MPSENDTVAETDASYPPRCSVKLMCILDTDCDIISDISSMTSQSNACDMAANNTKSSSLAEVRWPCSSNYIDPDYVRPFLFGWRRVLHTNSSAYTNSTNENKVLYIPPVIDSKETKRKMKNKNDVDRYLSEISCDDLSVLNFTFHPRPLGLDDVKFEEVIDGSRRHESKSSETSSGETGGGGGAGERLRPRRKCQSENNSSKNVSSSIASCSKSVNSNGANSDGSSNGGGNSVSTSNTSSLVTFDKEEQNIGVEYFQKFVLDLSLVEQCMRNSHEMRYQHRKRRRWHRDQDPPVHAQHLKWTHYYEDDPLGVYTEMEGCSRSPCGTPPPLRSAKLTPVSTGTEIRQNITQIKEECADEFDDQMASRRYKFASSHDLAISRAKNASMSAMSANAISQKMFSSSATTGNRFTSSTTTTSINHHAANLLVNKLITSRLNNTHHDKSNNALLRRNISSSPSIRGEGRKQSTGNSSGGNGGNILNTLNQMIAISLPRSSDTDKSSSSQTDVSLTSLVDLVILNERGRYQPVRFANSFQIKELVPIWRFDEANKLRRTIFIKAKSLSSVSGRPLLLAIRPSSSGQGRGSSLGGAPASRTLSNGSSSGVRRPPPSLAQLPKSVSVTPSSSSSRTTQLTNQQKLLMAYRESNNLNTSAKKVGSSSNSNSNGAIMGQHVSNGQASGGESAGTSNGSISSTQPQRKSPQEEVSILVKKVINNNNCSSGDSKNITPSKPILLNIPKRIVDRVRPGLVLSFSSAKNEKFCVVDATIRPPVYNI